jgi:hypothetical protein
MIAALIDYVRRKLALRRDRRRIARWKRERLRLPEGNRRR